MSKIDDAKLIMFPVCPHCGVDAEPDIEPGEQIKTFCWNCENTYLIRCHTAYSTHAVEQEAAHEQG